MLTKGLWCAIIRLWLAKANSKNGIIKIMQPHILKFLHISNYKEQFSNRKDNNRKVNIFKLLKNDRFFIFLATS